MPGPYDAQLDLRERLVADVQAMLGQLSAGHPVHSVWGLLGELLHQGHSVKSYYVRSTEDHCNIAVLTQSMVFDLDAPSPTGHPGLTATLLENLGNILFHWGPYPTVTEGESALLTVVATTTSGQIALYWTAHNESEAERLRGFGSTIVAMQSNRGGPADA